MTAQESFTETLRKGRPTLAAASEWLRHERRRLWILRIIAKIIFLVEACVLLACWHLVLTRHCVGKTYCISLIVVIAWFHGLSLLFAWLMGE